VHEKSSLWVRMKMNVGYVPVPVPRADNLTTRMCRLFKILGPSASWNPPGRSRPVRGLLYQICLYLFAYLLQQVYVVWEACGEIPVDRMFFYFM
jgi:hypothetical protein